MTEDEEFQLQVHQETQFDARSFDPNGDEFARSGFVFPRVRLFFNGRLTKPSSTASRSIADSAASTSWTPS